MKQVMKFYLLMIVAAFIYSCDDPYADETFQVYDMNPVSTYLSSRPDDFSEWITILKYADLYNAINQATEAFTVFAPDNEAVLDFYQKKGVASIDALGKEYAIDLVKYHIIGDSINYETFIQGGKLDKSTLSDDFLTVSFDEESEDGGINAVYINKEALVNELAIQVSNGYVYVLDAVLSPLVEPIYERLTANRDTYSLFLEAVDLTSWGDSLNTIYDEVKQPSGLIVKQKRNYTVLGVSNDAFAKDDINSLSDLLATLKVSNNDYRNPENELFRYVAYHIMKGSYSLFDLQSFAGGGNKRLWETAAGVVLEISLKEDKEFYINYDGEIDDKIVRAQFVEKYSDVASRNGMLHQIDAYLPAWESIIPQEVHFDFCDYPEIAAYIASNGTEGQKYQTVHESSEYRTAITDLPIFTVNVTSPSTPTSSYNYVDYFTAKTGNAWKDAFNGDLMILNLGYMGSIEMKTPTLIAGRYKVTLYFGYATSMNFMREANGGRMQFTFDGDAEKRNDDIRPMLSVPANTLGNYQCEAFAEIEFEKTGSHTLKVVVMDPHADTNSSFRLMLDYLHFEPIID